MNENYVAVTCTCSVWLMECFMFQVELDLLRTLPGNKHYACVLDGNIPKLRRVLLAFSQHDPVTGYCQVRQPSGRVFDHLMARYQCVSHDRLSS